MANEQDEKNKGKSPSFFQSIGLKTGFLKADENSEERENVTNNEILSPDNSEKNIPTNTSNETSDEFLKSINLNSGIKKEVSSPIIPTSETKTSASDNSIKKAIKKIVFGESESATVDFLKTLEEMSDIENEEQRFKKTFNLLRKLKGISKIKILTSLKTHIEGLKEADEIMFKEQALQEQKVSAKQSEIERLKKDLDTVQAELKKLQKEEESLQESIDSEEISVQGMQEKINKTKENFSASMKEVENEFLSLNRKVNQYIQ